MVDKTPKADALRAMREHDTPQIGPFRVGKKTVVVIDPRTREILFGSKKSPTKRKGKRG